MNDSLSKAQVIFLVCIGLYIICGILSYGHAYNRMLVDMKREYANGTRFMPPEERAAAKTIPIVIVWPMYVSTRLFAPNEVEP